MPLPCPALNIRVDVPADPSAQVDLQPLPSRPGVFLLQDETGGTLALATTANLRRMVAARLEPVDETSQTRRRANFRALTRTVQAVTVGSAFEADWAYLQLARQFLPLTYQSALDRWQSWFVHCDPAAPHPQFLKTAHPGRLPAPGGINLGPFPDKHAAARYIELLQDAFDLCRYHHILIQAPHATACAYKEMGKCPAPCDGTISMSAYGEQIARAIEFASTPIEQWQARAETEMRAAAAALDFEKAQRLRETLARVKPAAKPAFQHVDLLQRFCFVAVGPGERKGWARLTLIRGGWIEPFCDIAIGADTDQLNEVVRTLHSVAIVRSADLTDAALENLGLVCWHLFRAKAAPSNSQFRRLHPGLDANTLARSLHRLTRRNSTEAQETDDISELAMELPVLQQDAKEASG